MENTVPLLFDPTQYIFSFSRNKGVMHSKRKKNDKTCINLQVSKYLFYVTIMLRGRQTSAKFWLYAKYGLVWCMYVCVLTQLWKWRNWEHNSVCIGIFTAFCESIHIYKMEKHCFPTLHYSVCCPYTWVTYWTYPYLQMTEFEHVAFKMNFEFSMYMKLYNRKYMISMFCTVIQINHGYA